MPLCAAPGLKSQVPLRVVPRPADDSSATLLDSPGTLSGAGKAKAPATDGVAFREAGGTVNGLHQLSEPRSCLACKPPLRNVDELTVAGVEQ